MNSLNKQPTINHLEKTKLENINDWEKKNFYQRLGISNNASEEQIKTVFKKLSLKYHPDTISNDEELRQNYEKVQTLIGEAKSTLLNSTSRAQYDRKIGTYVAQSTARHPSFWNHFNEEFGDSDDNEKESNPETEAEKIASFVLIVKNGLGDYDTSLLEVMQELIEEDGIKKEVLVKALEDNLITYFKKYVEDNRFDHHEFPIFERMRKNLILLGIKEGKIPHLHDLY